MAKESELIRRIRDLSERSEKTSTVTHSSFLTPAEQYEVDLWLKYKGTRFVWDGGYPDAERKIVFFYSKWDEGDIRPEQYISCVKITAGFGTPSHRDYLGSILGLGLRREWIGDIIVSDNTAYIMCLVPADATVINELNHVSRYGVKCEKIPLISVPVPKKIVKHLSFTVQSRRFDAIVGGVFGISRSRAVKLIAGGHATLNYKECDKNDAYVEDGDVISVRGLGKAVLIGQSGQSRKGRLFLSAERYL